MSKRRKRLKYTRIILNKNILDISNIDGKPTNPEECTFIGKPKDIEKALIEFINEYFTKPVIIEIRKYSEKLI